MEDGSFKEIKNITDSIYNGKLKHPTAKIFLEILHKYGVRLRRDDGVFDHTISHIQYPKVKRIVY